MKQDHDDHSLSGDSPNNHSVWMKKKIVWEKHSKEEGTEGRKRKLYRETFFYSLVSCENVAEVAAYRLETVESQMIGHDFFSNDIFLKDF